MTDAYDLLRMTADAGVSAVLHGHVHSDQGFRFGHKNSLIHGVGSLGFQPDGNMNNQFAIYDFELGTVSRIHVYRYFANVKAFRETP